MSDIITVQEQLRRYAEQVRRTLPLIANPTGWTGLVDTLEFAADVIDQQAARIRDLEALPRRLRERPVSP